MTWFSEHIPFLAAVILHSVLRNVQQELPTEWGGHVGSASKALEILMARWKDPCMRFSYYLMDRFPVGILSSVSRNCFPSMSFDIFIFLFFDHRPSSSHEGLTSMSAMKKWVSPVVFHKAG